jgi:hypothetical protein
VRNGLGLTRQDKRIDGLRGNARALFGADLNDSRYWPSRSSHGLSRMLGQGAALKGCAARTGTPASTLDRDILAKPSAVMPFFTK